jgi:MFS family permease
LIGLTITAMRDQSVQDTTKSFQSHVRLPIAANALNGRINNKASPFFYGWVMLFVTTLTTMATSPGQSFVVGAFSDAIRLDMQISLGAFSAAYMIATFCASLPLTWIGRMSDKHGTKVVMTVVALFFGASCIFIGLATYLISLLGLSDKWQQTLAMITLTVAFFFLRFLGQGALGLVSSHALAMWFERRLGLAESIRHLGMPLAVAAMPALLLVVIETIGWRYAYGIMGVFVWVTVLPLIWGAYVNKPEDLGQHVDGDDKEHPPRIHEELTNVEIDAPSVGDAGDPHDEILSAGFPLEVTAHSETQGSDHDFTLKEAMRTRAYWIVTASMVLSAAVGTSFVFHTQPMMQELGLTKGTAAAVVGTLGVTALIMTIPFGHLVDTVRPRNLQALCGFLLTCACGLYAGAHYIDSPKLVVHGAFLALGLSQGLLFLLASPIFARYFGREHHGAIRGSLTTFMVIGTSAGPFVFAAWRTLSGDFTQVFIASGIVSLVLGAWSLGLQRPSLPNKPSKP